MASAQQQLDPARQAMDYFVGQGWTRAQAAGIVANLQAESGLRPGAVGDGGQARGIAQWHADRQTAFEHFTGHGIQQSTYEEQLQFVQHELTAGGEVAAGNRLRNTTTADSAGATVSRYYERPADRDGEATRRGQRATHILNNYPAPQAPAPPTP
ncbi:MAG TPA: phage tail tip lysozyme [Steroidobacteraceae bacterium]|nr:phage tail tip lysozyme [Steroidobacteraceae bacterium]